MCWVRIMLRFKVLVSVVPLIAAAILARIEFLPADHPCIAVASGTVQLATAPWHADLHVSFTDDPKLATVRVAVSDNVAAADFAVIDGPDAAERKRLHGDGGHAVRRDFQPPQRLVAGHLPVA